MKTALFFLLIFCAACSTTNTVVTTHQQTWKNQPVAKFEPSIPPPPSAKASATGRTPSSENTVPPLSEKEIDSLWYRPADANKNSLIRSNPNHFWAWMNRNVPSELKEVTEFQGQVVADPHYFNFGDLHAVNQSGLGVVDVDDSGVGPLYLDFVRYATFVKAYLKKDITPQLFKAYLNGLNKQGKPAMPDLLASAVNKTRADVLAYNQKWVQKNLISDKHKLDNKSLGITGLKDLATKSPDKVQAAKDLKALLISSHHVKDIYDMGYLVENSGSSRLMDRYWYSALLNDGSLSIYECKQLGEPATAYYAYQNKHQQRIGDVVKIYSDVVTTDSYVMDLTATDSYWCRPRHFELYGKDSVEPVRKDMDTMTELSTYFAYWIGSKQSQQEAAAGLLSAINANSNQVLDDTNDLIKTYEDAIKHLDNGSPNN